VLDEPDRVNVVISRCSDRAPPVVTGLAALVRRALMRHNDDGPRTSGREVGRLR
jgi:hypothetical protein